MSEKVGGRPPKFTTKEDMQKKIDAYFKKCEEKNKPMTITGLALALGFTSRQGLLNYQGKREFFDTISRAKSKVEMYAEERLFDKDGASGAKFSLENNFEGWREKKQIEADVKQDISICIELSEDD